MKRRSSRLWPFVLLILAILIYWRGETWLRHLLLYLSTAPWARDLVTRMPLAQNVAGRFVAGATMEDVIVTARELNEAGYRVSIDYLGEAVSNPAEANAACAEIMRLLDRVHEAGVQANVSVKPSQLGLAMDAELGGANIRAVVAKARATDNWIRLDMEDSPLVDRTLELYRQLRGDGFDNVGVVIQAYLYRSADDVAALVEAGARVRLCKGAYAEPAEVAYPVKADTDANYVRLMQMLLSPTGRANGVWLGVATHDEAMIQATIDYVRREEVSSDFYEFQMLYGIRRELQENLRRQGYPVRIYVPYGEAWYPYFVRRLAERPANLWFFISNYFKG